MESTAVVSPMCLTVAADWRGRPIPVQQWRNLELWRSGEYLYCSVEAPLIGDPAPKAPPGRLWELWEHEVVELFIGGPDARYFEVEFGPHGHYLALQLEGEHNIVGYDLLIEYRAWLEGDDRWRAEARIPWDLLPPAPHRLNAYAMSGPSDARRRLALYELSGDAPDFHQTSSFRPQKIPFRR